jgi:hypothetical protein
VALSICAEIIAEANGGTGRPLRETKGPMHRRFAAALATTAPSEPASEQTPELSVAQAAQVEPPALQPPVLASPALRERVACGAARGSMAGP